MAACEEYLELISRYVDGDLSGDESEALFEHLSHCAGCAEALSSFEELRMMTADTVDTVPEQLRSSVMASVDAAKNRPWFVRYRFTAVAAVFALVILGASVTPLARFLTPQTAERALTEESASAPLPTAFSVGEKNAKAKQEQELPTARKAASGESSDAVAEPVQETTPETEDTAVPVEESGLLTDASPSPAVGSEHTPLDALEPEAEKTHTDTVDPALFPPTPYDRTFSSYLVFSAKEAPEVLYSITSDQTVDHAIYYIVTPEQLTFVQSVLLENGVKLSVIPGDPESDAALVILTIEEQKKP